MAYHATTVTCTCSHRESYTPIISVVQQQVSIKGRSTDAKTLAASTTDPHTTLKRNNHVCTVLYIVIRALLNIPCPQGLCLHTHSSPTRQCWQQGCVCVWLCGACVVMCLTLRQMAGCASGIQTSLPALWRAGVSRANSSAAPRRTLVDRK